MVEPTRDLDPTLDPEDWESFRSLAHQMVDTMIDRFRSLDSQPVWTAPPSELIEKWKTEGTPKQGIGEAEAFELFCREILPYGNGSWHPRFLGWVQGTGVPLAMMADMLASGLNSHLAGFHTAPKWIELTVLRWIAEWMGYPSTSSGILTNGGSMANIMALHVARYHQDGPSRQNASHPLRIYASDQVHGWIWKGVEFLGLGKNSVRLVPSIDGRLDLTLLEQAILEDRSNGVQPCCLIANVGTVHTGAIDDLEESAVIAKRYGLWLHMDGAFGAFARLVPEYQVRLKSLPLADSIAVDLHKWMYLPFDIGTLLIRDATLHEAAFANPQVYMSSTTRGLLAGGVPLADRGVDLTRSFRALKAWMCLQAYGIDRFAACIEKNLAQAREMANGILRQPELELLAPVDLNVVCFRHRGRSLSSMPSDPARLNAWNQEILLRLQESGEAVLSSTMLQGTFALRAAFTNHRTRRQDIARILDAVLKIASTLTFE